VCVRCSGELVSFVGFMLTKIGIEANPDRYVAIMAMRSSTNVNEVQRLTGRISTLSCFFSASGDKGYPYFKT